MFGHGNLGQASTTRVLLLLLLPSAISPKPQSLSHFHGWRWQWSHTFLCLPLFRVVPKSNNFVPKRKESLVVPDYEVVVDGGGTLAATRIPPPPTFRSHERRFILRSPKSGCLMKGLLYVHGVSVPTLCQPTAAFANAFSLACFLPSFPSDSGKLKTATSSIGASLYGQGRGEI